MMIQFIIAAEAAAEGGATTFPPFDTTHFPSQLFWLAILFGTLYFVLSRFILPGLGGVLEHREGTIANDLDEAARLNDKAVEAQKSVDIAIAQAHAKARETASKARAKMDAEISEATTKVDAELDARLTEAETRISALREAAMSNVESIASSAAGNILDKLGVSAGKSQLDVAVKSAITGR